MILGSVSFIEIILLGGFYKPDLLQNESFIIKNNEDEIVRIRISIFQLFKNFRFSIFLLFIYLFYCFLMMRYEISHLMNPLKYCRFFVSVPLIYVFITFVSGKIMDRIRNWFLLCVLILSALIFLSIIELFIRAYFPDWEMITFLFFTANMILLQKVVFVSINSTMLKIFDIENMRVRNYLSCFLKSYSQ